MAQYIEEKVADLERQFQALGRKNDQVLTGTLEGRVRRLEEIVEFVFGAVYRGLEREQQQCQLRLGEIGHERITLRRKQSLRKSVPVKRKRAEARR